MSAGARALGLALLLLPCAPRTAAAQFDSAYRFRVLPTSHFVIYYHQGEDRLAARLARIAEDTWRAMVRPFGILPPARTHVVLVDQTELPNGYATPFPRDTVVIYAVWPTGSDFLKTDDWLRLVFTHEFTHIVHLDRSAGWVRPLRTLFGRVPVAFPNTFLPTWQIEGIATYEESAITGEGRLNAGDFRSIVEEAARARRLEPIDRANGGLTTWPGGSAAYAYGAAFHAYLAQRYGSDPLAALAEFTARRLPFLGALAFKDAYGRSLGELWREFEDMLAAEAARVPAGDRDAQLTHHGFIVSGPRFGPGRCATCPDDVWYSVQTPDEFPAIYRVPGGGGTPQRVTTRYLGSTLAMSGATVYFDQQEFERSAGLYSDLYALDRASGHVRRVTHGARLVDPDVSPDGRFIAAAQNRAGARDLVLVDAAAAAGSAPASAITVIASATDTQFNAPRWSPDGTSIAVERHRPGAQSEIVVVNVATRAIRVVAADTVARWVTPAWRPDGRAIVAAADFNRESFNLYEIDLDRLDARQLTHVTGGATAPDVSPDGTRLVYVGYTAAGFEIFKSAYARPLPTDVSRPAVAPAPDRPGVAPNESEPTQTRPYSPWATLRPTSWWPILQASSAQSRLGATTTGSDVLGYHAYAASATWGLTRPSSAPAAGDRTPDWQLSYVYGRWQPSFFATASRETSFFAGSPRPDGRPSTAVLRERVIEAGVIWPVRHVRLAQMARVSLRRAADDYTLGDGVLSLDRSAARFAWSIASAHRFGNSISLERGISAGVTAEIVRRAIGASADVTTITGDGRAYLSGFGAHDVVALRVAGGASSGDRTLRQAFLLGGAGPNADPAAFASDAFSLLRGFPADSFAGSRAAIVNADYRWPIARVERGLGVWPVFLHTVHAAIFADAGHAWTASFAGRDVKTSIGLELSADLVLGYRLPITAAVGAAWGHDGRRLVPDGVTVYLRLGSAF